MGGYITGPTRCATSSALRERASSSPPRCRPPWPPRPASIRHLKESDVERQQQRRQVARLRARLDEQGIPHLPNPSHIIPVMIKDPVKCRMISDGRSRCSRS
jgi:5-aminolevulinate synthase